MVVIHYHTLAIGIPFDTYYSACNDGTIAEMSTPINPHSISCSMCVRAKIACIAEIENAEAVEYGITEVCGDELVVIETSSSIEAGIALEPLTDGVTEEMGKRLNQWVIDNI